MVQPTNTRVSSGFPNTEKTVEKSRFSEIFGQNLMLEMECFIQLLKQIINYRENERIKSAN